MSLVQLNLLKTFPFFHKSKSDSDSKMNNSTEAIGENVEEEARMEHLKTLIAVVPIVVNITFIIIISSRAAPNWRGPAPVIVSCNSAPS